MASYSSDTLPTRIEYHSADPYYTYTMYHPEDICWDVDALAMPMQSETNINTTKIKTLTEGASWRVTLPSKVGEMSYSEFYDI